MMFLLENTISETLILLFSLFPNIHVQYSWWCDIFEQCQYHVHSGWLWYWGALFLDLLRMYNQIMYKSIWLVFQRKCILCCHEYIICLYWKNWFICLISPLKDIVVWWDYDHLDYDKYKFKSFIPNIPAVFVACIDLISWMHSSLYFMTLMDVLAVFFWTVPGRDVVN